jgi:hypothetical protein
MGRKKRQRAAALKAAQVDQALKDMCTNDVEAHNLKKLKAKGIIVEEPQTPAEDSSLAPEASRRPPERRNRR